MVSLKAGGRAVTRYTREKLRMTVNGKVLIEQAIVKAQAATMNVTLQPGENVLLMEFFDMVGFSPLLFSYELTGSVLQHHVKKTVGMRKLHELLKRFPTGIVLDVFFREKARCRFLRCLRSDLTCS